MKLYRKDNQILICRNNDYWTFKSPLYRENLKQALKCRFNKKNRAADFISINKEFKSGEWEIIKPLYKVNGEWVYSLKFFCEKKKINPHLLSSKISKAKALGRDIILFDHKFVVEWE